MLRRAIPFFGLAALMFSSASIAATSTGLRGTVTLSPSHPVCVEGDPCTKPALGYVLSFTRGGRVIGRVTTKRDGTYRILLSRGRYVVFFAPRRPTMTLAPIAVMVVAGRITRVDFEIDTGLR